MAKIEAIHSYIILDGNGYFAPATTWYLSGGARISASLSFDYLTMAEAAESKKQAQAIVKQINELLAPGLAELEADEDLLEEVDKLIEEVKSGSKKVLKNATFLISLAALKAAAHGLGLEPYEVVNSYYKFNQNLFTRPTPIINLLNGGSFNDTNLDFEEFFIIPMTKAAKSFEEKMERASLVYHALAEELLAAGHDTDTGSYGGYAPDLLSSIEALELIEKAAERSGVKMGEDAGLGIDIGSTRLYDKESKEYVFQLDQTSLTTASLTGLYQDWLNKHPVIYLEDCLSERDWDGWYEASQALRHDIYLAGDRFFDNDIKRLRRALKDKTANTVVARLDAVYSLTELVDFIKLAQKHNYKIVLSTGISETADDVLADIAVGINADFIKAGSLGRAERNSKYNRLMEIGGLIANR